MLGLQLWSIIARESLSSLSTWSLWAHGGQNLVPQTQVPVCTWDVVCIQLRLPKLLFPYRILTLIKFLQMHTLRQAVK